VLRSKVSRANGIAPGEKRIAPHGLVTRNGLTPSGAALDAQLRGQASVPASTSGPDVVIPLPSEAMYVLLRLKR
jgi:hypothetical protein